MVCAPVHLAGKLSQQLQVVRGHHHQCAGFTDAVQKFCNGMSGFRIQVSGRLIRKDYLRRVEHCTRNHNALLLTTRQFIRQLYPLLLIPTRFNTSSILSLISPLLFQPVARRTNSRLSYTVRSVSNWKSWNTIPSLRRNCGMCLRLIWSMSYPNTSASPDAISSSP